MPIILTTIFVLGFFIWAIASAPQGIFINKNLDEKFVFINLTFSFLFLAGTILSIVEIIRNLIKKKYRFLFPILGILINIPAGFISLILCAFLSLSLLPRG